MENTTPIYATSMGMPLTSEQVGNVSDGYHTFNELYEHRIILFLALCSLLKYPYRTWYSKKHSDGSVWDGWFIMGINYESGKQITYHLPDKYLEDAAKIAEHLEQAPEYDGHTPEDVPNRLMEIIPEVVQVVKACEPVSYEPSYPILQIAKTCHQVNKAICELNNDFSQKDWDESENWQKTSAVKGVEFSIANPECTPKDQHDAWCKSKIEDGWVFGETKDAVNKTHPCLVEYDTLPEFQKTKDKLFISVVKSFIN